jgi:topoisomerase IA-like protein
MMRDLVRNVVNEAVDVALNLAEGKLSDKKLRISNESGKDVVIEVKSRFITARDLKKTAKKKTAKKKTTKKKATARATARKVGKKTTKKTARR